MIKQMMKSFIWNLPWFHKFWIHKKHFKISTENASVTFDQNIHVLIVFNIKNVDRRVEWTLILCFLLILKCKYAGVERKNFSPGMRSVFLRAYFHTRDVVGDFVKCSAEYSLVLTLKKFNLEKVYCQWNIWTTDDKIILFEFRRYHLGMYCLQAL